MKRAVEYVIHTENNSWLARTVRWLNTKTEDSVSSNFTTATCCVIVLVAAFSALAAIVPQPMRSAVIELFTGHPAEEPADTTAANVSKVASPPVRVPASHAYQPFINRPAAVKMRPGTTGQYEPYGTVCEDSAGGPVPGAGGPRWARDDIGGLVLGAPAGVGAYVSGCLDVVASIRDPKTDAMTAWAAGYLSSELLSVATTSTDDGPCLILGSAAQAALSLLQNGARVSCTGRHENFGAHHGDAYLLNTSDGVHAFARCTQYTQAAKPAPYLQMSPLVSDAWARAQRQVGHELLPESLGDGRWSLRSCDDEDSGITIEITGNSVVYTDSASASTISSATRFDWTSIPA